MRRKTGVLAALAIAATCAFSANAAFTLQCKGTGKQNATVYLRWSSDYFKDESVTYSVYRSEDNTNWGAPIATGIPRLEYFDISPKPGKTYYYKVETNKGAYATNSFKVDP